MIFGALRQAASGGIKGLAASAAARGGGVSGWARTGFSGLAKGGFIGFSGLAKGGFIGFGMYVEAMSTGREYGMGAGLARGAAYSVPYVGIAMMAYDIGKMVGNAAYDYQQAKRRSSFTRGFQDPFGTAATMRQRSQYNLNRGRASLGSEAFLFH
jgi:hypothetical protein